MLRTKFSWALQGFDARYVGFLVVVGFFSLATSSNAFLVLKAEHAGISPAWISGVYLAFNATYVLLSIPGGMIADRLGRPLVILAGFVLFAVVYAGFALADSPWPIAGLFIG